MVTRRALLTFLTGLVAWTGALLSGSSQSSVVASFMGSPEFGSLVEPVARLYVAYFGRNPDAGGLTYWVGRLRSGTSLNTVSNAFAASNEFVSMYGSLDDSGFVNRVYTNVLGRSADLGGLQYWIGRLLNHTLDRGGVMLGFSESTEYRNATWARVKVVQAIGFFFFLADVKRWNRAVPVLLSVPVLLFPPFYLIGLLDVAFPLRRYFAK